MASENPEIDKLLRQLWTLLDLANTTATAHDCVEQLDQVAALCDEAARIARKAVALR